MIEIAEEIPAEHENRKLAGEATQGGGPATTNLRYTDPAYRG